MWGSVLDFFKTAVTVVAEEQPKMAAAMAAASPHLLNGGRGGGRGTAEPERRKRRRRIEASLLQTLKSESSERIMTTPGGDGQSGRLVQKMHLAELDDEATQEYSVACTSFDSPAPSQRNRETRARLREFYKLSPFSPDGRVRRAKLSKVAAKELEGFDPLGATPMHKVRPVEARACKSSARTKVRSSVRRLSNKVRGTPSLSIYACPGVPD